MEQISRLPPLRLAELCHLPGRWRRPGCTKKFSITRPIVSQLKGHFAQHSRRAVGDWLSAIGSDDSAVRNFISGALATMLMSCLASFDKSSASHGSIDGRCGTLLFDQIALHLWREPVVLQQVVADGDRFKTHANATLLARPRLLFPPSRRRYIPIRCSLRRVSSSFIGTLGSCRAMSQNQVEYVGPNENIRSVKQHCCQCRSKRVTVAFAFVTTIIRMSHNRRVGGTTGNPSIS